MCFFLLSLNFCPEVTGVLPKGGDRTWSPLGPRSLLPKNFQKCTFPSVTEALMLCIPDKYNPNQPRPASGSTLLGPMQPHKVASWRLDPSNVVRHHKELLNSKVLYHFLALCENTRISACKRISEGLYLEETWYIFVSLQVTSTDSA